MQVLRHSFLSLAATTLDVPDTTLARLAGYANPAITMGSTPATGGTRSR